MLKGNDKANAAYKKLLGKANTNPNLEYYEETLKSAFIITPDNLWVDTGFIPATAPVLLDGETYIATNASGAKCEVIKRYIDLKLDAVPGSNFAFFHEELKDALPHDYADGSYHYTLKDYSGQEIAFGLNSWTVDISAGILTFLEGVPKRATTPFYISFYKYIGGKTFDGFWKNDGSSKMAENFYPQVHNDVATKQYVDDEAYKLSTIISKLTPDRPAYPTEAEFTLPTYVAFAESTGEEHNCTDNTTPTLILNKPILDGDQGRVLAYIDGVVVGKVDLTSANNAGIYNNLVILKDSDPYEGQNQKSNFYRQLEIAIRITTPLAVGKHTAKVLHTITGESPEIEFCIDDPSNPLPEVRAVGTSIIFEDESYVSGVPVLSRDASIQVECTILNTVNSHYGFIGGKIDSSHVQNALIPIEGIKVREDELQVNEKLGIRPNTYSEFLKLQIRGVASNGGVGPSHEETIACRVDTISDESHRRTAGLGLYPIEGYNQIFDSRESCRFNEELQLVAGKYKFPVGNYLTNLPIAGPNYDVLNPSIPRWAFFPLGLVDCVGGFSIKVLGASNFIADDETMVTRGLLLQAKIIDIESGSETGWLDCNKPYLGVGTPSANGDAAMVIHKSTAIDKRVTFGPITRSGQLYIRVGFLKGTQQFSTILVEID